LKEIEKTEENIRKRLKELADVGLKQIHEMKYHASVLHGYKNIFFIGIGVHGKFVEVKWEKFESLSSPTSTSK